jgi:hypothetical protein
MTDLTLPPVAKSFYMFCKNCDADRYHRVLAHTSSTTAKVECEVCHSRKSYSLPKSAGAAKAASTRAVNRAATSAANRARTHTGEYENRVQNQLEHQAYPYSIRASFLENQKIQHPKFGLGFVQKALADRVDVIFSDEVRTLIHNKK